MLTLIFNLLKHGYLRLKLEKSENLKFPPFSAVQHFAQCLLHHTFLYINNSISLAII